MTINRQTREQLVTRRSSHSFRNRAMSRSSDIYYSKLVRVISFNSYLGKIIINRRHLIIERTCGMAPNTAHICSAGQWKNFSIRGRPPYCFHRNALRSLHSADTSDHRPAFPGYKHRPFFRSAQDPLRNLLRFFPISDCAQDQRSEPYLLSPWPSWRCHTTCASVPVISLLLDQLRVPGCTHTDRLREGCCHIRFSKTVQMFLPSTPCARLTAYRDSRNAKARQIREEPARFEFFTVFFKKQVDSFPICYRRIPERCVFEKIQKSRSFR